MNSIDTTCIYFYDFGGSCSFSHDTLHGGIMTGLGEYRISAVQKLHSIPSLDRYAFTPQDWRRFFGKLMISEDALANEACALGEYGEGFCFFMPTSDFIPRTVGAWKAVLGHGLPRIIIPRDLTEEPALLSRWQGTGLFFPTRSQYPTVTELVTREVLHFFLTFKFTCQDPWVGSADFQMTGHHDLIGLDLSLPGTITLCTFLDRELPRREPRGD